MSNVTCPKCNEENPGSTLHCGHCGASQVGAARVERSVAAPLVQAEKPGAILPCDRCGNEAQGGPQFNYMCGDKLSTTSTRVGGNTIRYTTSYGNLAPVTVLLCQNCYKVAAQATWLRMLLSSVACI